MGGHYGKTYRNDKDIQLRREDLYDLFDMMTNQSESVVIDYLKTNPSIILQPLSFSFFVDTSVMVEGLPVTCECANELELCIIRTDCCVPYTNTNMIEKLAKCVKIGHCEHVMEKRTNDCNKDYNSHDLDVTSGHSNEEFQDNDSGGIFLLHLAIIINKKKIVRDLLPFCLDNDMFYSIWFTLKRRLSILYLALAHQRGAIVSLILKYVERTKKETVIYFISFGDLYKAIETHEFDAFEILSEKFNLEEADGETLKQCYSLAYESRSIKCLRHICHKYNLDFSFKELMEKLDEATKSGNNTLLDISMRLCVKNSCDERFLKRHLHTLFVQSLMDHNAVVVDTMARSWALNIDLSGLRYRGYSMLGWAEELDLTEIIKVLQKVGGYLSRGTKHCAWSAISSVLLMENEHLVEHIATLIDKGHDVNKKHADYTHSPSNLADKDNSVMIDETPFYVALKIGRYDIMGLLLLNGAEPLEEEKFLYRLTEVNVRANVFFLLLSCNALKSVRAGDTSLLRFMIERSANVISTNVRPCFRDLVYLFLETCESLCNEDKEFLTSVYIPQDILDKYHQQLHKPLSLSEICRRRLRCHFGVNYQLFINIVRDQGCPRRIIDILMYQDMVDKYFSSQKYMN